MATHSDGLAPTTIRRPVRPLRPLRPLRPSASPVGPSPPVLPARARWNVSARCLSARDGLLHRPGRNPAYRPRQGPCPPCGMPAAEPPGRLRFEPVTGSVVPRRDVLVQHDVEAPMRDGVVLRANVYRPADDGRYPVLLSRQPY